MPDFKGRKDFPEVADEKIRIGNYGGTGLLAVSNIYSPKEEPFLRDRILEPVKGKPENDYGSKILSQQPTIMLDNAEGVLIKAIDDYLNRA